jgi:hypothetical protein
MTIYETVVVGGVSYRVFPKYDLEDFNEESFRVFARVLLDDQPSEADLEALGITVGGEWDFSAALSVMRKYTMVFVQDGRVWESHMDGAKDGQTEHVAFVQHIEGFANWSPLSTNKKKRKLRGLGAKAAAKKRPRRSGREPRRAHESGGGGDRDEAARGGIEAEISMANLQSNLQYVEEQSDPDRTLFGCDASDGSSSKSDKESTPQPKSRHPRQEDRVVLDLLDGAAVGVPPDVHARMLQLAQQDGIPITTQAQRRRAGMKRGSRYGVPETLKDAFQYGYIHPNLPPPLGLLWRASSGAWRLVPQGG